MLGKVFRSKTAAVITTAIVTASVVGGIAYAASSPIDSGGVIHGCYNPTSGAISLKTGAACPLKGKTTPISWNSQGVQGIQGIQGNPGVNGNDGAQGPKGDTGDQGVQGPSGVASCSGYPHTGVDWSVAGSTPGNGCDLRDAVFRSGSISLGSVKNANLSGASFGESVFDGNGSVSLRATGTDFSGANMHNARFMNLVANQASFVGSNLTGTYWELVYVGGSDFTGANFTGAFFGGDVAYGSLVGFFGTNLSDAIGLSQINLSDVDWNNTTCPDHTNSDNNGDTCIGHL